MTPRLEPHDRELNWFHYGIGFAGLASAVFAAFHWSHEISRLPLALVLFMALDVVMYDPAFQVNLGSGQSKKLYVALSVGVRFAVFQLFGPLAAVLGSTASDLVNRIQSVVRSERSLEPIKVKLGRIVFVVGKESLIWLCVGLTHEALHGRAATVAGPVKIPFGELALLFLVNQAVVIAVYSLKEAFQGEGLSRYLRVYGLRVFAFEGCTVPVGWLMTLVYRSPDGGTAGVFLFGLLLLLAAGLIRRFYDAKQQLSERVHDLTALNRTGQVVTATNSFPDLIGATADELNRLIPADGLTLAVYDDARKNLKCLYVREGDQIMSPFDLPADIGLAGYLASQSVPLHLTSRTDVQNLPVRHTVIADRPLPESVLGTALRRQDNLQGIVLLQRYSDDPFTESEARLLGMLSAPLATAFHNVRLYENLQKVLDETRLANKLKSEFLNNVSHELRTPLTIILGWSQILQQNQPVDQRQHQAGTDAIRRSADTLLILINDLLDLSRIDQGTLEISPQMTDMNRVISQAVQSIGLSAENKGIRVELALDKNLPFLSVDPPRMQQVLWNLLSNAVKFTPPDGKIRVSSAFSNRFVNVSITDTGIGIAEDALPYIFDRFRQGDGSMTRRYGGTGIGLSIVKTLVDLHGARIGCRSEAGRGTTFTLELPVPETQLRFKSSEIAKPTVYIIDPNQDVRDITAAILESAGFTGIEASDIADARRKAVHSPPAVVLLDLSGSTADGERELDKLRLDESFQGAKFIALTTSLSDQTRERLKTAGFTDCLAKPFQSKDLLKLLTDCVT